MNECNVIFTIKTYISSTIARKYMAGQKYGKDEWLFFKCHSWPICSITEFVDKCILCKANLGVELSRKCESLDLVISA